MHVSSCKAAKVRGKNNTEAVACENILVVEDNPLIMELVRTLLLSFGYESLEAYDGITALRLCKK